MRFSPKDSLIFPWVTIVIGAISLAIFAFTLTSPSQFLATLSPERTWILFPFYFVGTNFLHLSWGHLLINLVLWGLFAGRYELEQGALKLLGLVILASILGGLAEWAFNDLKFSGLSISIFALIAASIFDWLSEHPYFFGRSRFFTCAVAALLIFLLIGIEAVIAFSGGDKTAVAAHVGGAMAGLFSKLGMGSRASGGGFPFRPMRHDDVGAVLDIIFEFDEDDGEEAEESFQRSLEHKFVVEIDGRIAGMTGFTVDDHGSDIGWLSWTYVHDDFKRQGIAFQMMQSIREKLERAGMRKVFIATSDYICEDTGKDIYKPARNFYENKLNATREIVVKDYYGKGESKYVYSLPVRDHSGAPVEQGQGIYPLFIELLEADESEGGYVIGWDETERALDQTAALLKLIEQGRQKGAHAIFVTMPSGLSANGASSLTAAGFKQVGRITDYYAFGVDDTYWAYYFDGDANAA